MTRNGGTGSELCLGCTDSSKYNGSKCTEPLRVAAEHYAEKENSVDINYYPLDPSATNGTQLYWNIDARHKNEPLL